MAHTIRKQTSMTEGVIWKKLLLFALPLMVGNVFQQLYSMVDSIVVGNYVGKEALAGIGTIDPIINMFIGLFMGMATGAGVVISQYFGAQNEKQVEKAVHSTIVMTAILSVAVTIAALLSIPALLHLLGTPEDVYDQSATYLKIYFAGATGLLFYNMGSGILRAVGDSRRPLYFLIFSTILNIILDLLFVAVLKMGIAGAGYATIIAQGISAVLVLLVLTKEKQMYRIRWNRLCCDPDVLHSMIRIGLPCGLQMLVTAFSNVFIQSYINFFGSAVMAGWSAYMKIDLICFLPTQSLGLALTTFVAQNLGADKPERAKSGARVTIIMGVMTTVLAVIPVEVFAVHLVGMFNGDPEVLHYGSIFLRMLLPVYPILCFNQAYSSSLHGAGNTKIPVAISMFSFIVMRQIYMFVVSRFSAPIFVVIIGYPLGWITCSLLMTLYYFRTDIAKYKVNTAI